MKFKDICPDDLLKLSVSISLLLTEKFDNDDICVIKNLICSVANNLSTYQTQELLCQKLKDKK